MNLHEKLNLTSTIRHTLVHSSTTSFNVNMTCT
jgi:hypothetical protein